MASTASFRKKCQGRAECKGERKCSESRTVFLNRVLEDLDPLGVKHEAEHGTGICLTTYLVHEETCNPTAVRHI